MVSRVLLPRDPFALGVPHRHAELAFRRWHAVRAYLDKHLPSFSGARKRRRDYGI
jgi:hypothetical protein